MADWNSSLTLGTIIPGLGTTLKNAKQEVYDALLLEENAKNSLLSQLNTKIAQLNAARSQALTLLNDITGNLDSTGVNKLILGPAGGGYNALVSEISAAGNKPITAASGYYAGTLMLVSAPDLAQAIALSAKLQKIFSIQ